MKKQIILKLLPIISHNFLGASKFRHEKTARLLKRSKNRPNFRLFCKNESTDPTKPCVIAHNK